MKVRDARFDVGGLDNTVNRSGRESVFGKIFDWDGEFDQGVVSFVEVVLSGMDLCADLLTFKIGRGERDDSHLDAINAHELSLVGLKVFLLRDTEALKTFDSIRGDIGNRVFMVEWRR